MMNPVLAQQELHVIELRRRELQAEADRDQCLRLHGRRSRRIFPAPLPRLTGVRAWCRAVGGHAASFGPRTATAVANETTEVSI